MCLWTMGYVSEKLGVWFVSENRDYEPEEPL
jgi:hypothetical protein